MSTTGDGGAYPPTRWWWIRHAPVPDGGRIYGQGDLDCDCSDKLIFDVLAREPLEADRGGEFEGRDARHLRSEFLQPGHDLGHGFLRDPATVDAEAVAEVFEMRRRVEPRPIAPGGQRAGAQRRHRALALRPGQVQGRVAPLRIAHQMHQAHHALQVEVGGSVFVD